MAANWDFIGNSSVDDNRNLGQGLGTQAGDRCIEPSHRGSADPRRSRTIPRPQAGGHDFPGPKAVIADLSIWGIALR
jgi:hypothetical protein